jgi:parallel beta-helix repeat protein
MAKFLQKKFVPGAIALLLVCGFFIFGTNKASMGVGYTQGDVIINEIYSDGTGAEWVELLNTSTMDISLSNFKLSELSNPNTTPTENLLLDLSGTIPAHGLAVFSVSGLNDGGDSVALYNGAIDQANLWQRVTYGTVTGYPATTGLETATTAGQSSAFVNGVWSISSSPTKGWFNDAGQDGKAPLLNNLPGICSVGSCVAGVLSNIGSFTDPTNATGLYFEKEGFGKISFSSPLNLTDQGTVTTIQGLGQKLDSTKGHIKFSPETTSALQGAGATLTMYGLATGGSISASDLIVKTDAGEVIPSNDPNYPAITNFVYDSNAGTVTFGASHFTQFDLPNKDNMYVSTTGDDTTGNGSFATPYKTIAKAITEVNAGGTVNLAEGTYSLDSQIRIAKAVNIIGACDSTVITKGSATWTNSTGSKGYAPLITISSGSNAVKLENLKVTGAATIVMSNGKNDYGHGINVVSSSNVTLKNITSVSNAGAGLIVNSSNVTAENLNTNSNGWYGVNVDKANSGDASFILTGNGVLAESTQIVSDNTTGASVTATGYTSYLVSGSTKTIWNKGDLKKYVLITRDSSTVYATVQSAITASLVGDTINIGAGTYTEQLTINKSLTLTGKGDTTVIQSPETLTVVGNSRKPIVVVNSASDVKIDHLKIDGLGRGNSNYKFTGIGYYNSGGTIDHVTITGIRETPLSGSQQGDGIYSNTTDSTPRTLNVTNNIISDYQKNGITLNGNGLTVNITGNTVTGAGVTDKIAQNGIQAGDGVTGTISNNVVSGHACDHSSCGSDWYNKSQASGIMLYNTVDAFTVSNNTVKDNDMGIYTQPTSGLVSITNNTVKDNRYFGILFETGSTNVTGGIISNNGIGIFNPSEHNSGSTIINNVQIINNSTANLQNDTDALIIDATKNWWGSSEKTAIQAKLTGSVTFEPYYTSSAKTSLSDATYTDATYTSDTEGQADIPSNDVVLDDDTKLDLSAGTNEVVSGSVTIGGESKDLDGGLVAGVDLTEAQTVGDETVTVGEAVKMTSSNGDDVLLSNSELTNVSVAIPSGTTVMAPSGWDGKITPPKADTGATGNAPSGFSVGNTKIEVGSSAGILLFDKPVKITLTGVTGTVGYRPAGSDNWKTITTQCTSATDYSNISFPGECYFQTGSDTVIWTYHFTTFGNLNTVTSGGGGGGNDGGGGGGGVSNVTSACVGVDYDEWQTSCVNNLQYRNIKALNPTGCAMTSAQREASQRACSVAGVKVEDTKTTTETKTTDNKVTTPKVLGAKTYANGTLLKGSSAKIYLLVDGKKYHIKTLKELWSYRGKKAIKVTDEVLAQYTDTNTTKVAGKKIVAVKKAVAKKVVTPKVK